MENMIKVDELFIALDSKDNNIRFDAFKKLMDVTENEVSWSYEYWQTLINKLASNNSFQRSIGLLLLANLSKSDPEDKFVELIEDYLSFFDDEKFITSRLCIQHVWRIAVNKEHLKSSVLSALINAFHKNIHLARNENLIRQDVISSLVKLSTYYHEPDFGKKIDELIASVTDRKVAKNLAKLRTEMEVK